MIRLLRLLIYGHVHKWETTHLAELTVNRSDGGRAQGHRYHLRCKKCGEVVKRDLIGTA
jgi:hypothetical protein